MVSKRHQMFGFQSNSMVRNSWMSMNFRLAVIQCLGGLHAHPPNPHLGDENCVYSYIHAYMCVRE